MPEANNCKIVVCSQYNKILSTLKDILGNLLGVNSSEIDISSHFVEQGVESLFLLQLSRSIQEKFGIK
ncbi:MAG: acyl carrier protein, partial [Brasilonema sp.]